MRDGQASNVQGRKKQGNPQSTVEGGATAAEVETAYAEHILVEAGTQGLVGRLKVPCVLPPEPPEIDRGLVSPHLSCPEGGL